MTCYVPPRHFHHFLSNFCYDTIVLIHSSLAISLSICRYWLHIQMKTENCQRRNIFTSQLYPAQHHDSTLKKEDRQMFPEWLSPKGKQCFTKCIFQISYIFVPLILVALPKGEFSHSIVMCRAYRLYEGFYAFIAAPVLGTFYVLGATPSK